MLKKAVQQGRSEGRGEAYAPVRWASERCENAAGGLFQHPANGASPIRISRQSGYVGIVEWSLNRHDNHSGICGPILRTMPVSIRSGWAS